MLWVILGRAYPGSEAWYRSRVPRRSTLRFEVASPLTSASITGDLVTVSMSKLESGICDTEEPATARDVQRDTFSQSAASVTCDDLLEDA
jgi:hypothetical protein